MSRKPTYPDLENPPYCKVLIQYGANYDKKSVVKGFQNIQYLYPDEEPERLSVLYGEDQDEIPIDAELLTDQPPGAEPTYELVFNPGRVNLVLFEEEWETLVGNSLEELEKLKDERESEDTD